MMGMYMSSNKISMHILYISDFRSNYSHVDVNVVYGLNGKSVTVDHCTWTDSVCMRERNAWKYLAQNTLTQLGTSADVTLHHHISTQTNLEVYRVGGSSSTPTSCEKFLDFFHYIKISRCILPIHPKFAS